MRIEKEVTPEGVLQMRVVGGDGAAGPWCKVSENVGADTLQMTLHQVNADMMKAHLEWIDFARVRRHMTINIEGMKVVVDYDSLEKSLFSSS